MTTSQWLQIATISVLGVTLLAVLWYAWEARKQAKATEHMVKETRRQREDAFLPILNIVRLVSGNDLIRSGVYAIKGQIQPDLNCDTKNVGIGPALDVEWLTLGTGLQQRAREPVLPPGEHIEVNLVAEQGSNGTHFVAMQYRDVLGRHIMSRKSVSVANNSRIELGPLEHIVRSNP